ncbi:bf6b7c22-6a8a-4cbf-a28b-179a6363b1d9 [Thermothielavioides terrestris]|jgi:hypothetical protein
MLKII